MDGGMFRGLETFVKLCFWLAIIFIPLGLWQLINVIIWLFEHITIS